MSCAILNTMKLCINQARTDISGEKALSYIDGVVNPERERTGGRRGQLVFPNFHDFHISCFFVAVNWSHVLIGRTVMDKLNWGPLF